MFYFTNVCTYKLNLSLVTSVDITSVINSYDLVINSVWMETLQVLQAISSF